MSPFLPRLLRTLALACACLLPAAGAHAQRDDTLQAAAVREGRVIIYAATDERIARPLIRAFEQRYAGERFVQVMPLRDAATLESGYFDVQACNDSNRVDLFVFANETQVLLMARLDNLGKGASGAAVQAMNVHLGLDEGLGL